MTLGMLSCSAFALLGAWLVPKSRVVIGLVTSWSLPIVFITIPLVLCYRGKEVSYQPNKHYRPFADSTPEKVLLIDGEETY